VQLVELVNLASQEEHASLAIHLVLHALKQIKHTAQPVQTDLFYKKLLVCQYVWMAIILVYVEPNKLFARLHNGVL
jgi:hypothetical protein